ncbi:MAG: hypothetical protein GEV10_28720 [Streptosporangiales bacterium]|nr:hypothetical protein [Streptosporangiales bacterium]
MAGEDRELVARMWEARVAPEQHNATREWARSVARSAESYPDCEQADVWAAPPDRVVLITQWRGAVDPGWSEEATPGAVVKRAHAWTFQKVSPL